MSGHGQPKNRMPPEHHFNVDRAIKKYSHSTITIMQKQLHTLHTTIKKSQITK